MKKHLFTRDTNERNTLSRTSSWNYEGIGWHSNASNSGSPVYRLYRMDNHSHFYTTSAHERNELVRVGIARSEGVAWYQP